MGIYEELGVKPFINAVAPHTRYGGSIMASPVLEAMAEAARRSVNLCELQRAAGRAIATLHTQRGILRRLRRGIGRAARGRRLYRGN